MSKETLVRASTTHYEGFIVRLSDIDLPRDLPQGGAASPWPRWHAVRQALSENHMPSWSSGSVVGWYSIDDDETGRAAVIDRKVKLEAQLIYAYGEDREALLAEREIIMEWLGLPKPRRIEVQQVRSLDGDDSVYVEERRDVAPRTILVNITEEDGTLIDRVRVGIAKRLDDFGSERALVEFGETHDDLWILDDATTCDAIQDALNRAAERGREV